MQQNSAINLKQAPEMSFQEQIFARKSYGNPNLHKNSVFIQQEFEETIFKNRNIEQVTCLLSKNNISAFFLRYQDESLSDFQEKIKQFKNQSGNKSFDYTQITEKIPKDFQISQIEFQTFKGYIYLFKFYLKNPLTEEEEKFTIQTEMKKVLPPTKGILTCTDSEAEDTISEKSEETSINYLIKTSKSDEFICCLQGQSYKNEGVFALEAIFKRQEYVAIQQENQEHEQQQYELKPEQQQQETQENYQQQQNQSQQWQVAQVNSEQQKQNQFEKLQDEKLLVQKLKSVDTVKHVYSENEEGLYKEILEYEIKLKSFISQIPVPTTAKQNTEMIEKYKLLHSVCQRFMTYIHDYKMKMRKTQQNMGELNIQLFNLQKEQSKFVIQNLDNTNNIFDRIRDKLTKIQENFELNLEDLNKFKDDIFNESSFSNEESLSSVIKSIMEILNKKQDDTLEKQLEELKQKYENLNQIHIQSKKSQQEKISLKKSEIISQKQMLNRITINISNTQKDKEDLHNQIENTRKLDSKNFDTKHEDIEDLKESCRMKIKEIKDNEQNQIKLLTDNFVKSQNVMLNHVREESSKVEEYGFGSIKQFHFYVALDESGSMSSHFKGLKQCLYNNFINPIKQGNLSESKLSLFTFDNGANRKFMNKGIKSIEGNDIMGINYNGGGTNYLAAFDELERMLELNDNSQFIPYFIFFTDGYSYGNNYLQKLKDIAAKYEKRKFMCFVIGFGDQSIRQLIEEIGRAGNFGNNIVNYRGIKCEVSKFASNIDELKDTFQLIADNMDSDSKAGEKKIECWQKMIGVEKEQTEKQIKLLGQEASERIKDIEQYQNLRLNNTQNQKLIEDSIQDRQKELENRWNEKETLEQKQIEEQSTYEKNIQDAENTIQIESKKLDDCVQNFEKDRYLLMGQLEEKKTQIKETILNTQEDRQSFGFVNSRDFLNFMNGTEILPKVQTCLISSITQDILKYTYLEDLISNQLVFTNNPSKNLQNSDDLSAQIYQQYKKKYNIQGDEKEDLTFSQKLLNMLEHREQDKEQFEKEKEFYKVILEDKFFKNINNFENIAKLNDDSNKILVKKIRQSSLNTICMIYNISNDSSKEAELQTIKKEIEEENTIFEQKKEENEQKRGDNQESIESHIEKIKQQIEDFEDNEENKEDQDVTKKQLKQMQQLLEDKVKEFETFYKDKVKLFEDLQETNTKYWKLKEKYIGEDKNDQNQIDILDDYRNNQEDYLQKYEQDYFEAYEKLIELNYDLDNVKFDKGELKDLKDKINAQKLQIKTIKDSYTKQKIQVKKMYQEKQQLQDKQIRQQNSEQKKQKLSKSTLQISFEEAQDQIDQSFITIRILCEDKVKEYKRDNLKMCISQNGYEIENSQVIQHIDRYVSRPTDLQQIQSKEQQQLKYQQKQQVLQIRN